MAESFVSAIIQQIVTIATEEAKQRVKLVTGVEEEVERIKRHLQAIEVVLEDAEEKEMSDRRIRLWLSWLKEVAYEIEDVLDEWNTQLLKLKINGVGKNSSRLKTKVCSLANSCFGSGPVVQFGRRYDIASKIKSIVGKLDEIARQKDMYGLQGIPGKQLPRVRTETSSFDVDVSKLYGRDQIKEDIINSLLSETSEENIIKTISLVGMGGVGKTAVAQFVYHDNRVEQHFKRIWVCVSDVFEERNVAIAIIICLEGLPHDRLYTFDSLPMEDLLKRICTAIRGLKFFLVLDDVWADNLQNWERLLRTFKYGAPGSRILLTTRKETVANMMEYSHAFHLDTLSDDDCWMVLSRLAFLGRDAEDSNRLEEVGRKIAERCKGLPLAAKTLGSLLRFKRTKAEWDKILNSELWKIETTEQAIFAPLFLSYSDLPLPIRQCFKYCATFPKDHLYWRNHVIYHWMAQGFLGPIDGDEDVKLRGGEYVDFLISRSFFQDLKVGHYGLLWNWKLHDIVHDFAHFLMREKESVIQEINSESNQVIDLPTPKPRYLTAFIAERNSLPTSIHGAEELRSFVTISTGNAVSSEALRVIFRQAKLLRVVDFEGSLKDTLPEEIGKFIHLRHINLNGNTRMKTLPESVCDLCNLQYLDLNWCSSLEKLPDGIGRLINLVFFRTYQCSAICLYPKSIGKLTNLREVVGIKFKTERNDPRELSFGDLENMNHLLDLWIDLSGNATLDAQEVRRARLNNKTKLFRLQIISSVQTMSEDEVAAALNLPAGLLKFGHDS